MIAVKGRRVEFCFYRPQAQEAAVVGDFNEWKPYRTPMAKDKMGYWRATIALPEGEHKFRYLADGQSFTDYDAFGVREGKGGVMDSVLMVSPQKTLDKKTEEKR